jgi:hypothetical protein
MQYKEIVHRERYKTGDRNDLQDMRMLSECDLHCVNDTINGGDGIVYVKYLRRLECGTSSWCSPEIKRSSTVSCVSASHALDSSMSGFFKLVRSEEQSFPSTPK